MKVVAVAKNRMVRWLSEMVYDNPVVAKELRTRMRGAKAFAVMGAYALFVALVMLISSYNMWANMAGGGMSLVNRNIGGTLFLGLMWTQTILLSLIIPSLTSGAITMELEKRTIELLALTRLTPGRIVLGKQLSGVLYALILIISSLPVAGMCFMFGGISPGEVAVAYVVLIAWVFLFASVGVFWSSMFERTAVASLFSYAGCGFYLLFTASMGAAMGSHGAGGSNPVFPLAALCPAFATSLGMMNAVICGIHIPTVLVTTVLHLAVGTLLLYVAVMHVRYHRADTALPVRVLLMLITSGLLWLIVGDSSSGLLTHMPSKLLVHVPAVVVLILTALIGLASAVFATGMIRKRKDQGVARYAFSLSKVFKSDLGGGIPFVLLWGTVCYGTLGVTVLWAYRTHMFKFLPVSFWGTYFKLGIAMLSMLWGIASVGIFASSMTNMRRNAAGMVILFMLIAFVGYTVVLMNYVPGISNPNGFIWNIAALWPVSPSAGVIKNWADSFPPLWWSKSMSWLVTGTSYIVLGFLALAWASSMVKKTGGVQED